MGKSNRSVRNGKSEQPEAVFYREWKSPIGPLHLYASDDKLIAIGFRVMSKDAIERFDLSNHKRGKSAILEQTVAELKEYFAGKRTKFGVALHFVGTDFQTRAWKALLRIPYGKTVSYAEQAKKVGVAKAVRAVGTANGRNPIAIIIPCHRVISSSGGLGGYGGGLPVKQRLLAIEASN